MISTEEAAPAAHPHHIRITVNEHPVDMPHEHAKGLAIKEHAIAQHVDIQLDFILSEELKHGRTKIIGDTDRVALHPGSMFVAIPNDDNS